MKFLEKHPTPWTLEDHQTGKPIDNYEYIADANGNMVIAAQDAESYQAWFEGDIEGLIDFINSLWPAPAHKHAIMRSNGNLYPHHWWGFSAFYRG